VEIHGNIIFKMKKLLISLKIGVVPIDEKMMVLVMCRGEQLVHC